MLTGMISPTSGDAHIYGHSLVNQVERVRQSMGLCQQFDVLFDDLTVLEHFELVCDIKDIPEDQMQQEIQSTLELVMLLKHADKQAKHLSGGMKRKLSLGMALLGNSKILILDM